jgi:hypothetical protein
MKKLLSILTVALVLAGMLHISVARHYCGGELAATKVSLHRTLATCGMENTEGSCQNEPSGDRIESHCCDDELTSYSVNYNFTPAATAAADLSTPKIPFPDLLHKSPVRLPVTICQTWSDISPPGFLMTSSVDLSDIRVLRI